MINEMKELLKIAIENIRTAQQKQAKYADRHRRNHAFKIGDLVLLSADHLNPAAQASRPSRKLQPKFIGPFEIIAQISPVAF